MFKEYELPFSTCIGGWFIPNKICDDIIKYFNKNQKDSGPGEIGLNGKFVINPNIKESVDIRIDNLNNDKKIYDYKVHLQKVLFLYLKKYRYANDVERFNLESFNIQKYSKKGGYKFWHHERKGRDTANRVLTFMTYLNDVKKGGTDFFYQELNTPAKKGLTLIWPVDWTHTHRSQIANQEKIITTGWFEFI